MKQTEQILIYHPGNLGDTICAIPAMVALRKHFPSARIGLLTNAYAKEILEGNDFIDEIITFNPSGMKNLFYAYNLGKKIYSMGIDLLVFFPRTNFVRVFFHWLFFKLSGCRTLVGFKILKPAKNVAKQTGLTPISINEVEYKMSLLSPLGINPLQIEFRLPVKKHHKEAVNTIWSRYQLGNKNIIIAICPGGKFAVNHWPVENYIQAITILQDRLSAAVLLIGSASDKNSGEEIIKACGNSVVNLIGETSCMESAEILSRCSILISNDCGIVHLAAAVGTPIVGIYSSRNLPGSWHPWGGKNIILRNDSPECRFCFRAECDSMQCIKGITVKQVVEASIEQLNRRN